MARRARPREEDLPPIARARIVRYGGRCSRLGEPRGEILARAPDEGKRHLRMLGAAELGALRPVDASAVRVEEERRRVAGDQVALADEVRHPEAVNDVA